MGLNSVDSTGSEFSHFKIKSFDCHLSQALVDATYDDCLCLLVYISLVYSHLVEFIFTRDIFKPNEFTMALDDNLNRNIKFVFQLR